jgi:16S rRNA (guanine527-N7)-methyltransferase
MRRAVWSLRAHCAAAWRRAPVRCASDDASRVTDGPANFRALVAEGAERMAQLEKPFNLRLSGGDVERFARFLELVWARNVEAGLMSKRLTPRDIVLNHLFDSLMAAPQLDKYSVVADMGSGGGFPGLPLALLLSGKTFHLFEKNRHKREHLERAVVELGAGNVSVHGAVTPEGLMDQRVEVAMARGFLPLGDLVSRLRPFQLYGGAFLLFKGRRSTMFEEVADTRYATRRYRAHLRIVPVPNLADRGERNLLIVLPRPAHALRLKRLQRVDARVAHSQREKAEAAAVDVAVAP